MMVEFITILDVLKPIDVKQLQAVLAEIQVQYWHNIYIHFLHHIHAMSWSFYEDDYNILSEPLLKIYTSDVR